MNELELKFQVPATAAPALRAELRRRGARVVHLAAIYYDTADFTLARAGLALRMRQEGPRFVQTLKAKGRNLVERFEHNVPLRGSREAPPAMRVDRHEASPAGAALRAALDRCDSPRLAARYATDVRRLKCDLKLPGAVVEAAFDEGTITAGPRSVPVRELELELKSGDVGALCALAAEWSTYGGLWLDTRSKSARGFQLAHDAPAGAPAKATRPDVQKTMDGAAFLRAVVRATLDQVLGNTSEIAAGSGGEEHVHQARVGLRRLRTALRELADLDPGLDGAHWEGPLARVFAQLGVARDAVTAARAARPLLEHAQAPKVQWDAQEEADPVAAVRDAAFQRVLIELLAYGLQDPVVETVSVSPATLRANLSKRLAKLHKRVARAARDFEGLSFEAQHKTRKRLKRLRYLAEFAAPIFHAKQVAGFLVCLEPAQDALGEHVDIATAMQKFRADAAGDTQALFAAGYLEAHLADTARSAQVALKKVARAQPFWDR